MHDLWPETRSSLALAFQEANKGTQSKGRRVGVPAPPHWNPWLRALFPTYVKHPFAAHHEEFWEWVWAIEIESEPDPFAGIWARGGAKSTSVELGTCALGVRNRRRYALYVRETQDQADNSVQNIAGLLESRAVETYYPEHADRMVGKFGDPKGWRRNRLRTAGGFTVDALGLDAAGRGVKVDEQRPDLIILDDIDGKHDSPATTAKKISTITTSILPARSENGAVLAIQNLITANGFFTRMVDGRADYLARRKVSGPHPAVRNLVTEERWDEETKTKRHIIIGGQATWEGQNLAQCQKQIDTYGLNAFRKECQHEVKELAEGIVLRNFSTSLIEDLTDEEAKTLVKQGRPFGGVDFGAWRFAFNLRVPDTGGRLRQIAEYFSQRDEMEDRARVIHALLTFYGCPDNTRIWGDSANPTDIMELNAAFKRIKSPYRVVPVANENKARAASVERMDDLHMRAALLYRRSVLTHSQNAVTEAWKTLEYSQPVPDITKWFLGMGAASPGTEMTGSRLLWEIGEWSYPVPKEGEAQSQDPDDHTADGADAIASDRYAIMSFWRPGKEPEEPVKIDRNEDKGLDKLLDRMANRRELMRTNTLVRKPRV